MLHSGLQLVAAVIGIVHIIYSILDIGRLATP